TVFSPVQIIYRHALKHTNSDLARLICSAVVHLQTRAAPTYINAALAQYNLVASVDALVAITHDKQIVGPLGYQSTNQHERLRTHILGFIHDDRAQLRPQFGVVFKQAARVAIGIIGLLEIVAGQQMPVALKYRPDIHSLLSIQPRTAADARGRLVLICGHDRQRLNNPRPLLLEERQTEVGTGRLIGVRLLPQLLLLLGIHQQAIVIAMLLQKTEYPGIKIDHLDTRALRRVADL